MAPLLGVLAALASAQVAWRETPFEPDADNPAAGKR